MGIQARRMSIRPTIQRTIEQQGRTSIHSRRPRVAPGALSIQIVVAGNNQYLYKVVLIIINFDHNRSFGMVMAGWTIVLDVGKTHSKATLWNESGHCVAQRSHTNQRVAVNSSLTLDVFGIEAWLAGVLAQYAALGPVRAIVPVAHG